MGECRLLFFLVIGQVLQNLWHFEILTLESIGNPKTWNITKTDDRRAKQTKIWDSGYYSTHMEVTFGARFLDFGLGPFGALCKISHFTIFNLLAQFSSVSSKLYIIIMGQYRQLLIFGAICQTLRKLWHFEIFLNTGPYAAENFKMLFLPQFSLEPIQTL